VPDEQSHAKLLGAHWLLKRERNSRGDLYIYWLCPNCGAGRVPLALAPLMVWRATALGLYGVGRTLRRWTRLALRRMRQLACLCPFMRCASTPPPRLE
jgi:hypothetical protein